MSKPKKRKPRIRKKLVSAASQDSIPFPKVRVEWIDILSDSGWADEKQFNKMKLASPVNEGWVYSKDKESIIRAKSLIRTAQMTAKGADNPESKKRARSSLNRARQQMTKIGKK